MEAARSSFVRGLWARSMKPDENLGRSQVGPSPQQITHGSAVHILEDLLQLDATKDRFVDLGCGRGLILALALCDYNVPVAGIELDSTLSGWAYRCLLKSRLHEPDLLRNNWVGLNVDIMHAHTTLLRALGTTAAYSFDKDFPGDVLFHMMLMLKHSLVTRFVSSRPSHFWDRSVLEWTGQKLQATVCGSGERHTFYLYKVHHCSDACILCKKTGTPAPIS